MPIGLIMTTEYMYFSADHIKTNHFDLFSLEIQYFKRQNAILEGYKNEKLHIFIFYFLMTTVIICIIVEKLLMSTLFGLYLSKKSR
jgi:hypothetical protein